MKRPVHLIGHVSLTAAAGLKGAMLSAACSGMTGWLRAVGRSPNASRFTQDLAQTTCKKCLRLADTHQELDPVLRRELAAYDRKKREARS